MCNWWISMGSFDFVIVTAPNEDLCEIYQLQLSFLCQHLEFLSNASCLCIADPNGVRIGSGGGTLNALSKLIDSVGQSIVHNAKIVIIHSGGDSRRSPLHSVVGKAWSHINSSLDQEYPPSSLSILLHELEIVGEKMHKGSLVVASSDVLIHLSSSVSSLAWSTSITCSRINSFHQSHLMVLL
jgi:fucokinase